MSQPSVASFFNTRKRATIDEAATHKNRVFLESKVNPKEDAISQLKALGASTNVRTRSGRVAKRTIVEASSDVVLPKKRGKLEEQNLVEFIKKGKLSPCKKNTSILPPKETKIEATQEQSLPLGNNIVQKLNESSPSIQYVQSTGGTKNQLNLQDGMRTPTKQIIKGSGNAPRTSGEYLHLVKKELNFDEVKSKLSRSSKLQELKASLIRIQELEKTRKAQEERNRRLRENLLSPAKKQQNNTVQLKEFDTIELEVLTSPVKNFKTPTKLPPPTPDKNELMSPRHTDASKRLLFSPAKNGSPSKIITPPAYQRFQSLLETSKAGKLPLPFKYRNLIDIFKALDSVCAMFYNRRECITFKKLKPAVQRMLRKNFNEIHLAQLKQLYPQAYHFTQMKMRNYGSTSKSDYFQLVICPNVSDNKSEGLFDNNKQPEHLIYNMGIIDEDNLLGHAQSQAMNPHVMTERLKRIQLALLDRVHDEHDKFLKSLDPPLNIARVKVTRWHPDFDLENCPDVPCAHIPQPPNVEKYSSARDILSTARNLFNCATPMERVMERYEAKLEAERDVMQNMKKSTLTTTTKTITTNTSTIASKDDQKKNEKTITTTISKPILTDTTAQLLKSLPKSLLEKVRAKQAARALDQMTRRPSQDREATKYSRLPELARHLRNVFVTERKGVLTLEVVIKKIQNSFRTCLTAAEIEEHLQLMNRVVPEWVALHEVRKTMYVKISRDFELKAIIVKLEDAANVKSK